MKKVVLLLAALLLLFSGCAKEKVDETPNEPEAAIRMTEAPTEPATETPVQTDAPVPAYPAYTVEFDLSDQEARYRINIFLSNFAEQEFNEVNWHERQAITAAFQRDTAPAWQYVDFMFTWYGINGGRRLKYDGNYAYLTMDQINEKMVRYFGRTLSREEFEDSGYEISGDRLRKPWGDGDSHGNLSIARQMWGNGQGQYLVRFHTLTWDEMATGGNVIIDKSVYNLDYETACGEDWLSDYGGGYAIVEEYRDEGVDSYNLIAYWLDGQTGP